MQILLDFIPLIAFFAAYMLYDLYVATATLIVALALQIAYQWFRHGKVNKMLLTSGVIAAVLGGITLALRNPLFIQWKVTVVYWLLALALLGSEFFGAKNLTERAMGHVAELKPTMWRLLNSIWVVTFAAIGGLNLYVMYNVDERIWVYFKTWGVIGLLFLMIVGQAVWISWRTTEQDADSGNQS
jgi:intracellular septation protein